MAGLVFIGDEATAAGYRLCGVRTLSPPLGSAAPALRRALDEAPALLLVSAAYAFTLPAAELRRALLRQRPPMLLVGNAVGQAGVPDLAAEVRRQLGLGDQ